VPTRSKTAEAIIARNAGRAEGIVTREELIAAGLSDDEILHRRRTGALIDEYPGVYRAGHRSPSVAARYMAAVKACGHGAALSGLAASWFYGVTKGFAPPPEVTSRKQHRLHGVITHQARRAAIEATTWRRMPITTLPRALVDIAGRMSEEELARACHEAGVKHGVTPAMVESVLNAHPNAPGAAKLRRVLRGDARVVLSRLEKRFLEILTDVGLPCRRPAAPPAAITSTAAGQTTA
jgi:hypothetical protein